ncbi:MAG: hypothetical protein PHP73_04325 [Candidatus Omnitrophica bacterium]|nr:hypothetical protein [Candidatus Omnitrophota bacterium]
MNKGLIKNTAFILLLGITAFSMVKYISELKARYNLQDNLLQARGQLAVLTQEKQNLLQDLEKEKLLKEQLELKNAKLKGYLRAGNNKIKRLFQDNAITRNNLEDAGARLSILKAENRALIDSHKRIYMENERFKLKLSSVVELKKAIKELRGKKRRGSDSEAEGNRGFLIRAGQPTVLERVKIEVLPAQTKK